MAKFLKASKRKWRRNRKLWRIFVNGHEIQHVRACKLGLRGWVEVNVFDENGICLNKAGNAVRTKRICNVTVNAIPVRIPVRRPKAYHPLRAGRNGINS